MFSRRHPYLFFILTFSTIIAATTVMTAAIIGFATAERDSISGEKVGVVEVVGTIMQSKKIIGQLKDFRENDHIRAIVLRIDSPGGGVGPSQEIFREIQKTGKIKKVVASLGSVAASGGYYAAAAADVIVANPGTITGSIGVIMGFTNLVEVMKKIGLSPVVVKSGQFKDIGSPARAMSDKERHILQRFVDKIHLQFVSDVASARKMEQETLARLADGRIYTGEEAKELGLVDRMGNLEDTIELAGRMGGIEGKIQAVYPPAEKISLVRHLMESSVRELSRAIKSATSLQAQYRME